ncbi:hypothetical protein GCL60_05425 [Silvanigrella paludirubra]|uniref:Phytochrome chromophore attachment site domain-containing protein n=1 Tax=Silvanigrella paludirubra TaxID=2499159 RepID=A0A6N6VXY0_9BACT|nr:hypothetical protein [Silvanigrella paludirubra]KAB8039702.1 hypothetical protein GCL60_05425 [Silvanigrella paludirubra]
MIKNQPTFFQNQNNTEIDLTNLIQSDGVFIGINTDDFIVKYVSQNFFNIFNFDILEKSASLLFSQNNLIKLNNYVSNKRIKTVNSRIILSLELKFNDNIYKIPCNLFFSENILCIEFSSQFMINTFIFDDLNFQDMLNYVKNYTGSLKELTNNICQYISETTGFERTFYCDFLPDEHGFIRACYSNKLESLLNHHFPVSDIPMQLREVLIKNRFRLISRIDSKEVTIEGCSKELDLSFSFYRNMSPIHLQYLKNLGVTSLATYSVVLEGRLQGIFGSHSITKKYIPITILEKIQILVEEYSRKLFFCKYKKIKKNQIDFNNKLDNFIQIFEKVECNLEKIPENVFNALNEVFNTHYIFYRYNNRFEKNMKVPLEFADNILEYVNNIQNKNLIISDKLSNLSFKFEKWAKSVASGMILIKLNEDASSFIVLLRKEYIQTIKWAGSLDNCDFDNNTVGLNNSFKTWYQEVLNKCKPWLTIEYETAHYLKNKLHYIQSNNFLKLKNLNKSLSTQIFQNELLFSKIHQGIKNTYSILNTIFNLNINNHSNNDENINKFLLHENKLSSIDAKYYFENLSEKIISLVKENFYENIKINLEIEKNTTLKINQTLKISLIFHEFILISIKYSKESSVNKIISVNWSEKSNQIYFSLNDNTNLDYELINLDSKINVDFDLIRYLINQLNGTGVWNKKNGLSLKIVFEDKKNKLISNKLLI